MSIPLEKIWTLFWSISLALFIHTYIFIHTSAYISPNQTSRLFFRFQKNTGQNGGKPKLDLNVAAAWAQGITGKNITTAIMDDGVDYMHPDLINNYVSTTFKLESPPPIALQS